MLNVHTIQFAFNRDKTMHRGTENFYFPNLRNVADNKLNCPPRLTNRNYLAGQRAGRSGDMKVKVSRSSSRDSSEKRGDSERNARTAVITRLTIVSRTWKIASHGKRGIPDDERVKGQQGGPCEITRHNPQTSELGPRSNCEYDCA